MKWKELDKSELTKWAPKEKHQGWCWIRYKVARHDEVYETVGYLSWLGKGGVAGLYFECDYGNVSEYVTHYCPIEKPT